MANNVFYILIDGKRYGTMVADHFTLDNVVPNGVTTPLPTTIFDKYYRDLNGGAYTDVVPGSSPQAVGTESGIRIPPFGVIVEGNITPGSPDTAVGVYLTAPGGPVPVSYSLPDDAMHIAPRQLKYQESQYQFWGDGAGTVLVGIVPYSDNIGIYNQVPNAPAVVPP